MTQIGTMGRLTRQWRIAVLGGAGLLLLAPLIAMQVTDEVAWTGSDFGLFGAMLLVACAALELAVRLLRNPLWRGVAVVAIIAAFLLVWAEGAVGLFH